MKPAPPADHGCHDGGRLQPAAGYHRLAARRLGYTFTWKSPLLWGIALAGAYAYEAVHFQMGEAFIVGYRHGGAGLYGLLFPILIGAFLPLSLVAVCIQLARRTWVVLLTSGLALALQYLATGVAAAGFRHSQAGVDHRSVRPALPGIDRRQGAQVAALLGNNGLIGLHQAWTMTLAFPALVLVALIGNLAWVRRRPLLMAAAFSISMVLITYALFGLSPASATTRSPAGTYCWPR